MQRIEKWLHQFRSTLYVIWNSYKIETDTIPVPSVMANYVVKGSSSYHLCVEYFPNSHLFDSEMHTKSAAVLKQ